MIIKVSGLPVNVTKSDLDELFSDYSPIKITENSVLIKIGDTESTAYLELEEDEEGAIKDLDRIKWRDNILYLDSLRGEELKIGQPGSGGTTTQGKDKSGTTT
jgi:RNA recognition motif-containing protein